MFFNINILIIIIFSFIICTKENTYAKMKNKYYKKSVVSCKIMRKLV